MQQMQPEAKILTWALTASKEEQNNAFIEISQKIAVEYPEIFAKFLGDFQKKEEKSEKIPENSQDSRVSVTASDKEDASIIAYHVRAGNPVAAIKEFRTWTGCGLKEAKDCIDLVRDSKAQSAASYTHWDKIKLVLEYVTSM